MEHVELELKVRSTSATTNTVLETSRRVFDAPTVRQIVRLEVSAIMPNGDALVSATTESATVLDDVIDPRVRDRIEAELAVSQRTRQSWRMRPSGTIADVVTRHPRLQGAALARFSNLGDMHEISPILPDTPVGIGASWEVRAQTSLAGIRWERAETSRLTALTDSTATIERQVTLTAPSQALSVEPNATTRLTSGTITATASLVVPLRGLAVTGTSHAVTEANLLVVRGHLRISSAVQNEVQMTLRPAPATPP